MKGLFYWFKDGAKMKRWIMLILVGVVFASFGMANIFTAGDSISFKEAAKIVIYFVIGFTCVVLGLIFINKRTMELFIEATDDRIEGDERVNVNNLIFNKKIYEKGPKIVVLGGGSGLNNLLTGLKQYTSNITAVVTVSDYGENLTNNNEKMKYMQLEDIKNGLVSLSFSEDSKMKELMNYKFKNGSLKDIPFSDLYFSAMNDISRGTAEAVKDSNDIFKIYGKVLPITEEQIKICAELENGYVVENKSKISEMVYDKMTNINRVYLSPTNCKPTPGIIEAINEADAIIIGPGSLYTNIIPNLLVNGVARAIKESKAIKLYVCNIMTDPGQTDNYTVSDHINAIVDHCGEGLIDYCLYDTGEVIPEFIKKYNREGAELVEQDISNSKDKKVRFLKENLSIIADDTIRHDANLISDVAIKLICDDLRFRDKQNDPEYLMMNTKLKEDKRINKQKKKALKNKNDKDSKKKNVKDKKKKSSFAAKYSDRIESIKTSDAKALQRKKMAEERNNEQKRKTKANTREEIEARRKAMKKKEEIAQKKASQAGTQGKEIKINHKTLRPEDYEKIRKEMLDKFNNSKLKD